jgi:acyl-coenzyme A synthetase/AMP-(fatty) acid ligase
MSLVTSHLSVGSSVLVSARSVLDPMFWRDIEGFGVTHLAGVPQTYAMLARLGFAQMELPACRGLLQAGGRLHPDLIAQFHEQAVARGRRFYVMYGQTEAGPRMSCLPPERLPEKLGSVGLALPGGRFEIRDEAGQLLPVGATGEIHYSGPNVMMGYATCREDLTLGDQMGSVLPTGDLGHLDDEGFLYVSGRTKRIAKLAGTRVSLDEVEGMLADLSPVAAVAAPDDGIVVFTSSTADSGPPSRRVRAALGVTGKDLRVLPISQLPALSTGKVDYPALRRMAEQAARQTSGRRTGATL